MSTVASGTQAEETRPRWQGAAPTSLPRSPLQRRARATRAGSRANDAHGGCSPPPPTTSPPPTSPPTPCHQDHRIKCTMPPYTTTIPPPYHHHATTMPTHHKPCSFGGAMMRAWFQRGIGGLHGTPSDHPVTRRRLATSWDVPWEGGMARTRRAKTAKHESRRE